MTQPENQASLIDFMRSYLEKASVTYMADLERTPTEMLIESADRNKPPEIDFISDCTEENMEIAHILRGEKFSVPCYALAKEAHHTAEEYTQLTADLAASTNDLLKAIEEIGDDGLAGTVTDQDGEKLPAFRLATRAANHMKYHDLYTGTQRQS